MRLRSLAFVVSFIALSATARAQEWANYGTISAEPTAGRICSGDANGKDILCASPAPYVDTSGNLGIGTTTMTGKVNINAPSTQTAAQAFGVYLDGAQSTANSSGYYGLHIVPTYTAASGNTLATFIGVRTSPQNANTGTVTSMHGILAIPGNTSGGTVTSMVGVYGVAQNVSTGTVTTMHAMYARCDNTDASGIVTTCYGLYLATPTTTGAITNKYGVYQVDTNSTNYFGGAVRLAASNYLNWGATAGTSGYGFRDNAGALEYKNSGGSWTALNAGTATNFAAGTVSAPGLYVTGDSNTGLYQATADSVSITAGGVEAARFNTAASGVNYLAVTPSATTAAVQLSTAGTDSNINLVLTPKGSGNVGIGTGSPAEKLQVSGNVKVAGTIQTADASATCSVAADLGKFRYNTSTGKFQICK